MTRERKRSAPRTSLLCGTLLAMTGLALLRCSSSPKTSGTHPSDGGGDADDTACFPDNDGLTGGPYTIDLTVDDNGFSKTVINTQNQSMVTLRLKNNGTKDHGFEVGCTSVTSAYPNLPPNCPSMACFPRDCGSDAGSQNCSTIPPIAPGASATITFVTPTPDNLIYPFKSSAPDDSAVMGLNNNQWSLM
jgi:hypothetical protein